ncbi:MAG: NUDIX domain-containing protein [Halobacteriaceae archaeon]
MEKTHVVTCFLRHESDILLLKRSDNVGSYAGKWGGVAGHAEGSPDAAARKEIIEETGLTTDDVSFIRSGNTFDVRNDDYHWVVHPYLFSTSTRDITTNWETDTHVWVPPPEILHRDTVPKLWQSYKAVKPSIESIASDNEHGSHYLSIRALEVLRDRVAELRHQESAEWEQVVNLIEKLCDVRPSMVVIANRIRRIAGRVGEPSLDELQDSLQSGIDELQAINDTIASNIESKIHNHVIITISRSETVLNALRHCNPDKVIVSESRPGKEGIDVAKNLAGIDIATQLTTDAALPKILTKGDCVVIGADQISVNGTIINKVGSYPLAVVGFVHDIPVYVLASRDKIVKEHTEITENGDPLYQGDKDISSKNPIFELVPDKFLSAIVTEDGIQDLDEFSEYAKAKIKQRSKVWNT